MYTVEYSLVNLISWFSPAKKPQVTRMQSIIAAVLSEGSSRGEQSEATVG